MVCSISGEGPLTFNHFLLCRPHMRLKSLVNNLPAVLRERLQVNAGTTRLQLEQAATGICSRAQQKYEVAKIKWWAGRRWHYVGAYGLHTQGHLASWEDCESTQKFRQNNKELRHPDGYRNNLKTSSNPQPCFLTIVMCSGSEELSLKRVNWNTRIQRTHYLNENYCAVF